MGEDKTYHISLHHSSNDSKDEIKVMGREPKNWRACSLICIRIVKCVVQDDPSSTPTRWEMP